jgi:hypothetical protein
MKKAILLLLFSLSLSFNINAEDRYYTLNYHSGDNPDLHLKYMADLGDKGVYFLFEYVNTDTDIHEISLNETYRLVDNKNGKVYYPSENSLIEKYKVFPKTTHAFYIKFESLPRMNSVSFYENNCTKKTDFCLINIPLGDAEEATSDEIIDIARIIVEGTFTATVSFYLNMKINGELLVYIDDIYYGTITKYFKDRRYNPYCSEEGTLTVKISNGFHTFRAESSDGKNTWKGSFNAIDNECFRQGFVK